MKTLKDMQTFTNCIGNEVLIHKRQLKQSAIEDIKSYLKRKEEIKNGYEYSKLLRIEMYELNTKIEYIKEKFNITEEDLR